jgi:hypothetical protein
MSYNINYGDHDLQITCPYKGHVFEKLNCTWGLFIFFIFGIIVSLSIYSSMFVIPSEDFWKLVIFALFPLGLFLYFLIETLWQYVGKEEININQDRIIIRHQIFGIGIRQEYISEKVNGVFASKNQNKNACLGFFFRMRRYGFFIFKYGKVAFNYGGKWFWGGLKTFRVGSGMEWEEVSEVISIIHNQYPQFIYNENKSVL